MMIAGLKPENEKKNWEFISTMGALMTPNNVDGLGYTAVNTKGDIFGEKWLFNNEAFEQRKERFTKPKKIDKTKTSALKEMLSEFMDLEDEPEMGPIEKYGTFGNLDPKIVAITLHTRAASNTVCYPNIHPFVDMDKSVSVIHNGFIRNHTVADEIRSTCDSERVLNQYIEHEINTVPQDMQNFIDSVKGWFACGILSLDRDNRRVLDIFKTGASLAAAHVKELDAIVFSTSLDDIRKACRRMGFTIQSKVERVKEDTLLRLDATTGQKILTMKYRDTTKQYDYSANYHNRTWERDTDVDYWSTRAKEREEEEKKKAELKKEVEALEKKDDTVTTTALTLVPDIEEERPTEAQTQEVEELKRSGVLTDAEVKENMRERRILGIMSRNFTREVAEAYVTKRDAIDLLVARGWNEDDAKEVVEKRLLGSLVTDDIKQSKDIIAKVTDKLFQTMAAAEDYYWLQESGTWIKRVNSKH